MLITQTLNNPLTEGINKLGRINVVVEDELEKKVRVKAAQEFGGRRGSLTEAIEAALKSWVG